ncbi:uncharacterized protein LOC119675059 [Teleopsis dalmanni]|uniref:uncharacterized protein LOC119675059 n=1 Tax=Teleopsis dalmanni TaxID=139649 RepID=UPI0018CFD8A4|nr:uncharacterized protein LOC119675059 [Teleopsis dalmanni]
MAHDHIGNPPPEILKQLVITAAERMTGVVIGADANAHHTIWGSSDINERGVEPTFIIAGRKEVLDITLTIENTDLEIKDWRVLDEHSFSDHRYIQSYINLQCPVEKPYRNYRNTNWSRYRTNLLNLLPLYPIEEVETPQSLDNVVETFTKACNIALDRSCPLKSQRGKKKPLWWSEEIRDLRKSSRNLFNKAKRSNLNTDWDIYKVSLKIYKNEIKRAKTRSWKAFCESVEGCQGTARFRRILSKKPSNLVYLKDEVNGWTHSSEESAALLLNIHFPDSDIPNNLGINQGSTCDSSVAETLHILKNEARECMLGTIHE